MEEDTGVIEYVTAKRMMKARVPLAVWRVLTLWRPFAKWNAVVERACSPVREKKVKLGCACECLNGLHQHVVVRGLI